MTKVICDAGLREKLHGSRRSCSSYATNPGTYLLGSYRFLTRSSTQALSRRSVPRSRTAGTRRRSRRVVYDGRGVGLSRKHD